MSTCCCSLAGTAACANCAQNPAAGQNFVRIVGPEVNPPLTWVMTVTPSEAERLEKRIAALEEQIARLTLALSKLGSTPNGVPEKKARRKK